MTLTTFVTKSAFRNKRRTALTMLSIALSLALLTFMMTIWRAFYVDSGSEQSTQRLITRHRVSLTYEAEAEELTPERIIQRVFDRVEVP